MDAKLQACIDKLNSLNFKERYEGTVCPGDEIEVVL